MKKYTYTTFTLALLLLVFVIAPVVAVQSSEPVVIRVVSFNPVSRMYNMSCIVPPTASQDRTWSIRPDTSVAVTEYHTTQSTVLVNVSQNVMYHISCGTMNQSGYIMSDFHVDRRLGFEADRPYITINQTEGRLFHVKCNVPANVTQYSVNWVLNSHGGVMSLPQFNDQREITYTVPYAAQWEVTCNVWDSQRSQYLRGGLSIEFFNNGPAYIPTLDGCIPGEACPYVTSPARPLAWVGPWPHGNITVNNTPTNTTGNQTTVTTCYNSVQNIPATCTGGTITQNTWNGCRQIVCSNAGNNVNVLACDKTGFFEMYRQGASGIAPKVCLGSTCIQNNGYAKSGNFPICFNATNMTNTTGNQTNTTGNQTNTTLPSVTLKMAPWYPQGRNTILICNATGFSPVSYDFTFGDGAQTLNYAQNNVWHTYAAAGTYTATCVARNATLSKTAQLSVTLG